MSAYIVSMNTIHALTKGIYEYEVNLKTDYKGIGGIIFDVNEMRNAIGQKLLNQNYASVNYRYGEDTAVPEYEYEDIDANVGEIYGCIGEYEYQSCETDDYYESDIHKAFNVLKKKMLERFIRQAGYDITYGLD